MTDTGDNDARPGDEDIIDPGRRICDAHHHLWDRPGSRYLIDDFLADCGTGHNIVSSVFIEWRSYYLETGPLELRPVGETSFAARSGEVALAAGVDACAAIMAHADLRLGRAVEPVLAAHAEAGQGRFRGIRHVGTWDESEEVRGGPHIAPAGLYADPDFREGARVLASHGLIFDAWLFQTQHSELIDFAAALPELPIVYNHSGGMLGVGPYRGRGDEMFAEWRRGIVALSRHPNILLKLGGLGMKRSGFDLEAHRASSVDVAATWAPWIETAIEIFGADRCMFESNFPVDGASCSYAVLWNAFKRITAGGSEAEKDALFHDTAARAYRIGS